MSQNHPEKQDGEYFLGYMYEDAFAVCVYDTKRMGDVAYTVAGEISPDIDLKPIFVQIAELKEKFSVEERIRLFGEDFE